MNIGDEIIVSGKGLKTYGLEGKVQNIKDDRALVSISGMSQTWIALKNLSLLNHDTDPALLNATKQRLFILIPGHEDTVRNARAGRDVHDSLDNAFVTCAPSLESAIEREMEIIDDWLDNGDNECVLIYDGERYHEIRRGKVEVKPL